MARITRREWSYFQGSMTYVDGNLERDVLLELRKVAALREADVESRPEGRTYDA